MGNVSILPGHLGDGCLKSAGTDEIIKGTKISLLRDVLAAPLCFAFAEVVSIVRPMRFRFPWLLLTLTLWLVVTGCGIHTQKNLAPAATGHATVSESLRRETPAQSEQRAEAHAHFLTGLSLEQNDRAEQALAEYEKALALQPSNEELAVDLSRRYMQRKDYTKAIAALKKCADAPGASGLMFARLSLAYLQQGQTNAAIDASRTAIKRDPASMAGYQSLFHLHRALSNTNEARKVVEQAARQPKPDAPFLIDLAHLMLALDADTPRMTNTPGRVRAKELLMRAAGLQNTNLISLQKLAQGFMFVGDPKHAAETYLKILKEDSDLIGVREALVELYLRDNNSKGAAEQLQQLVRETPTNPQAYYFLGAIAYEEKRFDEALENYRKALLLGMDTQQLYFDIAATQLAQQKPREALDTLQRARKRYKQSFVGEFYSGLCYMRLKEYTNALEHFTASELVAKTSETNRLTHGFYFELGAAHERAGRIPEAERYFEQALAMSPEFPSALNYLGYMWAERGTNLARARTMIEKAVRLDPTNAAYLDSLGWVLFKQGHASEALDPIRKAVELNDEPDATLYDHLGDVYSELRQHDKAREAWGKALKIEPNQEIEKKLKAIDPPPAKGP